MKTYKALKNITGDTLHAKNTENLTVEQLGGEESVERLERIGAIEEMPTAKKAKASEEKAPEAPKAEEKTGEKAADTKEK